VKAQLPICYNTSLIEEHRDFVPIEKQPGQSISKRAVESRITGTRVHIYSENAIRKFILSQLDVFVLHPTKVLEKNTLTQFVSAFDLENPRTSPVKPRILTDELIGQENVKNQPLESNQPNQSELSTTISSANPL